VNGIAKEKKDSNPTKERVKAFKSRVFGLLLLFVEKAKDLTPLFDNLSQELFIQEPERIQELINKLLNRGGVTPEKLEQIAVYYKTLLLFKSNKNNQKFTEGFIRVIRTLHNENTASANKLVQDMLEIFLTKRKCKLQAGFFPFLVRKLPQLKPTLLERCLAIEQNDQLRPAQSRVMLKLKALLLGKLIVKVENE
jgi:hypothetical protein